MSIPASSTRLPRDQSDLRLCLRFLLGNSSTSYSALIARSHAVAAIPMVAGIRARRRNTGDRSILNHLTVFTTTDTPALMWEQLAGLKAVRLVRAAKAAAQVVAYGEGRSGWHAHMTERVKSKAIPYGVVVHDGCGGTAGEGKMRGDIRSDLAVLMPMMDDRTTLVLLNAVHPEVEAVWRRLVRVDGWSCVILGIARNMAVLQRLPLPVPTASEPEE